MKVFISCSGDYGFAVAEIMRTWLKQVIQIIHPFVSSKDIEKGSLWSSAIVGELTSTDFGIVCVTPRNVESSWLNFEAGALLKTFGKGRVAPMLCGLKQSDLPGSHPLTMFQATSCTKEDIHSLMKSINLALDKSRLDESVLTESFEIWWPKLENALQVEQKKYLSSVGDKKQQPRDTNDILNDILQEVRSNSRLLSDHVSGIRTIYANPNTVYLSTSEPGDSIALGPGAFVKPLNYVANPTMFTLDSYPYLREMFGISESAKKVVSEMAEKLKEPQKSIENSVKAKIGGITEASKQKSDGDE